MIALNQFAFFVRKLKNYFTNINKALTKIFGIGCAQNIFLHSRAILFFEINNYQRFKISLETSNTGQIILVISAISVWIFRLYIL